MVSLVDVTVVKGPLRLIVQFDGLRCPGTLALLSRDANSLMKENLAFVLSALGDAGVDMEKVFSSVAFHGSEAVVPALLAAGVDKDATSEDGATPLHAAARNGHEAVVSALLGAGAEKDAATQAGATPLRDAAENGHAGVVSALLAAGADKNAARAWYLYEN